MTLTILKALRAQSKTIFNVHAYLGVIMRDYSTTVTQNRNNQLILDGYKVPKLNIQRNQSRLTKAINALKLYIDNQCPGLENNVIQELMVILSHLETIYHKDPKSFVTQCKLLSNWFKVNVFKQIRRQDAIPLLFWNRRNQAPHILAPIFGILDAPGTVQNHLLVLRLIFSILEIYNVVTVPVLPSSETITKEFSGDMNMIKSINIGRALERLNVNIDSWRQSFELRNREGIWHTSSSSGPNGQALWMSHVDAKALASDKELMSNFRNYVTLVGREDLIENLEDTVRLPQFFKLSSGIPTHSKLHVIFEKGSKARIIAIGDYWTQEALTPLHTELAKILGGLDMDGTFNQDKIAEKVRRWTAIDNKAIYSLDLSAATDRLPVLLQAMILDHLTGIKGFGDAWRSLVVGRDFTSEIFPKVRYSTGQPMGFKSSFVMLGLTHHIIVQEAAARVGFDSFEDYVILGDDIVVANTEVAEQYKIIMEALGLEISPFKTIACDADFSKPIAEICKRVFVGGKEISPLPMKLMVTAAETTDMLYQLQEEMSKRSLINDPLNIHYFMGGISNRVAYKDLARMNGLPMFMTGLKNPILPPILDQFNYKNWDKTRNISLLTLQSYFTFTVMMEQLKRLGDILVNTKDIYTTLMKAANVSKTVGIASKMDQYLPVEDFSQEILDEWEVIKPFHPAIEVVKGEVDRINTLLNRISMASSMDMMVMLLDEVVDSLKISSFEYVPDKEYAEAKQTRRLVEQTLSNIQRSTINGTLGKRTELSYSIKLERINAIWNLKVDLDSPISINRNISSISSSNAQAIQRVNAYLSEGVFDDFLKDKGRR
ncbi:ORF [Binucleate Rhizoctonia mitovirus K1]|uniref:ORF n=1 Tax=Binucleate Rhizoctonia mitovirus K1 TaxID=1712387 RepID=UPI001D165160|nr:ORF [Binucleate Rhizoctonia mitovirus K1]ALD60243.2 ORF [Binucleate Rhizoctonia mitovirus K1]